MPKETTQLQARPKSTCRGARRGNQTALPHRPELPSRHPCQNPSRRRAPSNSCRVPARPFPSEARQSFCTASPALGKRRGEGPPDSEGQVCRCCLHILYTGGLGGPTFTHGYPPPPNRQTAALILVCSKSSGSQRARQQSCWARRTGASDATCLWFLKSAPL